MKFPRPTHLRRSAKDGELHRVINPGETDAVLDVLMSNAWMVYTKPCLNHAKTVVTYLARYAHRIGSFDCARASGI